MNVNLRDLLDEEIIEFTGIFPLSLNRRAILDELIRRYKEAKEKLQEYKDRGF